VVRDGGALAGFCVATVQGSAAHGKIERNARPVETLLPKRSAAATYSEPVPKKAVTRGRLFSVDDSWKNAKA
jgi:hypothetical protein